ncbi:MAG: hypothetical protein KJ072_20325 [Verrucomicrobia bacterium]|nr:hypothetical protein [Verrucomicrobiota bacterium]
MAVLNQDHVAAALPRHLPIGFGERGEVPDGYRVMDERKAIKVMVKP